MSRRQKLIDLRSHSPAVLPSLLLCDFANLSAEVDRLQHAGVEALHLDVMDGHFVPNFTYGMTLVEALRGCCDLPLDVHLMISNPQQYIQQFYDAGADILTIHAEATDDPRPLLEGIRNLGAAAGLAINPGTSVESIENCLDLCDLVLVMSVEPGFGGQSFNPIALEKLSQLRSLVGADVALQIDGGVNDETIASCAAAGAHLFVAGSAIFRTPDYTESLTRLTDLATSATTSFQR